MIFLPLALVTISTKATLAQLTSAPFLKCDKDGFTCLYTKSNITTVKYECPKDVVNPYIYINEGSFPSSLEKLEITNCQTIFLNTRCSFHHKHNLQNLLVANIEHLKLEGQREPMLPHTVVFENISNIESIPSRAFGQYNSYSLGEDCYRQQVDFQNILFKNASIDVIESNAFVAPHHFNNFSFVDVRIKRIKTSGIVIKTNLASGLFKVQNCKIDVIEHFGIEMYGKRSIFSENEFGEIKPNGINGTVEDFDFTNNFVGTVHPYGFSIQATNIFFFKNSFLHLKSGALGQLSPGIIQKSESNVEKVMFTFRKNSLNLLDPGSLNPDYIAYNDVHKETIFNFSRNKFLCSCDNLGWLFSPLVHGPDSTRLEPFYEKVLNECYANTCEKPTNTSCDLPLKKIGQMITCGKCLNNVTIQDLCDIY